MPSVMVTFASDFANNPDLVERLLLNGTQVARINCAHDNEKVWKAMINKGNHTIRVLKTLKEIMLRTAGHRTKKRFIFRPLSIAIDFIESNNSYRLEPNSERK